MRNIYAYRFLIALTGLLFIQTIPAAAHTPPEKSSVPKHRYFTENRGQAPASSRYYVQDPYAHVYIEPGVFQYLFFDRSGMDAAMEHPRSLPDELKPYAIKGHALRMSFLNKSQHLRVTGEKPDDVYINFYTGNHPGQEATGCKTYQQLVMENVYPNIDARIYFASNGNIKYDMWVRPGAATRSIQIQYEGTESIRLENGNLHIQTSVTEWIEHKPYAYQWLEGKKSTVPCVYALSDSGILTFEVGTYDTTLLLIIDPELIFSTYSGSTSDNFGATATYDKEGNLYAAGISTGPLSGYPATAGAFDITYNGGLGSWPQVSFSCDITISKYNNDGTALIYATYLGGNRNDYVHSLIVNDSNELIVLGSTLSRNFPVTSTAYDTSFNDTFDIVVTHFNKAGTALQGSTYFGGSGIDGISTADTLCMNYMDHMRGEVQVKPNGDILVGSVTRSDNFPVSSTAFQTTRQGAQDGCVFQLSPNLSTLRWSTYLGKSRHETLTGIEPAADGSVYVTGGTHSTDFSIKGNVFDSSYYGGLSDAWIARISRNGDSLLQFMYWGSPGYDQAYFVKTDRWGHVYIIGQTFDSVAITPGTYARDSGTLFISSFTANFDSLRFSTTLGNGVFKNVLVPSAFMVDICGSIYASVWAGDINNRASYRNGAWHLGAPSSTFGLPVTNDALQATTDGRDFYLFVLAARADSLLYATYLGEDFGEDHVDGGTSRFDSRGIIYQSVCASCGFGTNGTFPTTPDSYSPTNKSSRCSNASLKMDFRVSNLVTANFKITPARRCTDSVITFTNNSYNGNRYRWYINGLFVDTTTHLTHVFTQPGYYSVKLVAVDSTRCNIADSITKTVRVGTSIHSDFTLSRDTCTDRIFFKNLTVTQTGDTLPVLWDFGDGNTSTLQNPVYSYANSDAYPVHLYVIDSLGCSDTTLKVVDYDKNIHLLTIGFSEHDTLSCEPQAIQIFSFGRGGKQFYWYINDTLVSNNRNLDTVFFKGTYKIKQLVIDSATCKIRDSLNTQVTILPEIVPQFSIERDSCSFTLHFTNTSIQNPADTVPFIWYFGDGDSAVQQHASHTYDSAGTYTIRLTVNKGLWCEYTSVQTYELDSNTHVLQSRFQLQPPVVCIGDSVTFQNTSFNGYRQYWYINNELVDSSLNLHRNMDSLGMYTVMLIVFDTVTCYPSDTFIRTVTVNPHLPVAFQVHVDSCTGVWHLNNLTDTTGKSGTPFLWNFGDGQTSTVFAPQHVYAQNGTYTITLYSNPGTPCADSAVQTVVYDSTRFLLQAGFEINDSSGCIPAVLQATNTSVNNTYNYWYVNGTLAGDSLHYDTIIQQPGTYTITLITVDSGTCALRDTFSRLVTVWPNAIAGFILSRDSCSLEIKIENTSIYDSLIPITWFWDFGDGDTSTSKNPEHQFKQTGLYTIRLITHRGTLCADTAEQTYFIDGDTVASVFVPNVFTPNDDGLNDCFQVYGISPKCDVYHIWIRNRWGNLYYESDDVTSCWNGQNESGEDAAEGVYYYIIQARKHTGESYDLSGTLMLLRK